MRYLTLTEAAKPEEMLASAYKVRKGTSATRIEAATAALLAANPELRDLKRVPKGTIVLVPDLQALPHATDTSVVEVPLAGTGLLTTAQVNKLRARVKAVAQARAEQAAEAERLLKGDGLRKAAAGAIPEGERLMVAAVAAAKRDAEEAASQVERFEKAFAHMAEDMQRLRKRFA
jgi:phage tail protein X